MKNNIIDIFNDVGFTSEEIQVFKTCIWKTQEQMQNDIDAEKYIYDSVRELVEKNEI